MTTIGEAQRRIAALLTEAGIDGALSEARLLLSEGLGLPPEKILGYPELEIEPGRENALLSLAERRANREPMSHVLGHKEFWSLDFKVTPETLTPRPDSETLVEAVLDRIEDRNRPLAVLDLGTGTGCLLLALLHELPKAMGVGVDKSPGALAVARENANSLGLSERTEWRESDWFSAVNGQFDVVISNPPYIAEAEMAELEPEVARCEPLTALVAEESGLADYRRILEGLNRHMAPGGFAAFELGRGQAEAVSAMAADRGWRPSEIRQDLSGIERCLIIERI